jgi:hypothetical protein
MENLVVLHSVHALDLLGVLLELLRLLGLLGKQLIYVLYLVLQLGSLSLTRLELLAVTPHVSKPHDYDNHMFMRL